LFFFFFFLQVTVAINAGAGREREKKLSRPAHSCHLQRRVDPRATSCGGEWEDAPPRVQAVPEVSFNAILEF
jgi:hypothetical protein